MTRGASPLVSVIIPCFNYGRFLGEAIESVHRQSYAPIEIIVVDDGSTDDTQDVARSHSTRIICLPRRGVSIAVNTGVAAAAGTLIMRLDADDKLAPTYVEKMVEALDREEEAAFAYSDGQYFGAARGLFRVGAFDPEALAEGAYAVCLALTRRAAFESVGGYDPVMGALRCEDWDLWLTFAERGARAAYVPEALWFYRRHITRSRNTWNLSPRGLTREWHMIGCLQDRHPQLFRNAALWRRLRAVPRRVAAGQKSPRQAFLLVAFYGVMLLRSSWFGMRAVASV